MPKAAKSPVKIYHNPRCGTSRSVLEMIRAAGIEPEIVEYLKTPLDGPAIQALAKQMGVMLGALLRRKEAIFAELELGRDGIDDRTLLAALAAHPILLNRPIVVSAKGARLCRPAEIVRELL